MARGHAQDRIVPALALGVAAYVVMQGSGPLMHGPEINAVPAAALCVLAMCGFALAADAFHLIGKVFDWRKARKVTGLKGSAGFVKSLREIRQDLIHRGWGPYWGTFKGREIVADFASNALIIGTSGSGKGVGFIGPNIMALSERGADMAIVDFKGDHACVYAPTLRRQGYEVALLNVGDVWRDILGPSDRCNPQHSIADNFHRPGGLRDVSDDVHEECMQLRPEPEGKGGGDNQYFRNGGRTFKGFAIQQNILVKGREAALGDVAQMVNDRQSLLRNAQWAAGRLEQNDGSIAEMPIAESSWAHVHDPQDLADYTEYFRGLASGIADLLETEDSRTADSFLTEAQQSMARFNTATRAHKILSSSSFRFSALKEGKPKAVFFIADASRMEAQAPVMGLLQWAMFQDLKRHPNKERPVYFLADEATNFKISGQNSLLTWGRGYGIRLALAIQSTAAYRMAYGVEGLNIALSESEIKLFLPGQRDPETLALIEKLLGEQSVIAQSHSGKSGFGFGTDSRSMREDGRPLMTADEIRRTDKAILIIRNNKPILIDLPPIAAIHPWRKQIDINPFHGKAFLKPVKLRLKRRAAKRTTT